jgi:hypothetical protein
MRQRGKRPSPPSKPGQRSRATGSLMQRVAAKLNDDIFANDQLLAAREKL